MSAFFTEFLSQIAATSKLEWLAVVLAIAYVLLAAKQNSWCWLCAFASTAIYTWLFWQVTLPFQSMLNFFLYDNGGLWLLSVVKRGRRGHREAGTFMAAVDTSNDSPGAVMLCVGIV